MFNISAKVEDAFALLAKYQIQLTKEESEKIESLSYNWLQLQVRRTVDNRLTIAANSQCVCVCMCLTPQGKAMDVQLLLLTVQEHFQKELIANLEIFKKDCAAFVIEYHTNGPMQVDELLTNLDNLLCFTVYFIFPATAWTVPKRSLRQAPDVPEPL